MLSEETESKVINILKTIAKAENSIEISRQLLSDNLDFDPFQIFINLCPKGKQFVTPYDLVDYFNSKGIFISYTEAKLLILFYDQNYDGVLTYSEFLPLVQSKNSTQRTQTNSPIRKMDEGIDHYLFNLFQKEVDLVKELIKLLYDLRIRRDFDCHSIYHALKNVNKITADSLGDYFEKKLETYINDDLTAIIKRLDINKDGIVDLCELHAFFGFPNCTFCCSCTECPNCGICCCNKCLPDIPCYLHKCVHHQSHTPLKYKTLCQSPLKKRSVSPISLISPPKQSINNKNIPSNNSKFNNYNSTNLNFEEEEKNNNNNSNENSYKKNNCNCCGNIPENNTSLISESNIEVKNVLISPCKCCSPKRYYINSNCEMFPTSQTFSPSNLNFSQSTLLREINSPKNDNFSNSFSIKNCESEEILQFNNYLREAMIVENEIEKGKVELFSCSNINYENVFCFFDIGNKCYLTFEDLKDGLIVLDSYTNDDEINLLFNRFDPQKCGAINCENFVNTLLPYDNICKNRIESRITKGSNMGFENAFSYETKLFFKNLIKLIISGEKRLNNLKKEYSNVNCALENIFGLIDLNRAGCFNENELNNYLIEKGIFTDDKSSCLLFLRLDKNKDGQIDFCEIEDEFQPIN